MPICMVNWEKLHRILWVEEGFLIFYIVSPIFVFFVGSFFSFLVGWLGLSEFGRSDFVWLGWWLMFLFETVFSKKITSIFLDMPPLWRPFFVVLMIFMCFCWRYFVLEALLISLKREIRITLSSQGIWDGTSNLIGSMYAIYLPTFTIKIT